MKLRTTNTVDIEDLKKRFVKVYEPTGCWIWQGAIGGGRGMYGRVFFNGKVDYAHRVFSHIYNKTPLDTPRNMVIMHSETCVSTLCVNPAHLTLGTQEENASRAPKRGNVCLYGHPMTPDNVKILSSGNRRCLICYREAVRISNENETSRRRADLSFRDS